MGISPSGRSSTISHLLLGNINLYTSLMKAWSKKLNTFYPDKHLSAIFSGMPRHTITIMPMALCDGLAKDLDKKPGKQLLSAIGLCCLLISTHDDVVDEMPKDRRILASLVYGGNIAGLWGTKLLLSNKYTGIAGVLFDSISQNHYLQQLVVEKLWETKKITVRGYLDGIKHISVFAAIGPLCALAYTKKPELKQRVLKFAYSYGIALQLIDDLREQEEDKEFGYKSLPLLEGAPYKKSFSLLYQNIALARAALLPSWKNMNSFIDRLETFSNNLKEAIDG